MKRILALILALGGCVTVTKAGQRVYGDSPFNTACIAASSNTVAINMDRPDGISFQAVYTDTTPATINVASTSFAVSGTTFTASSTLGCTGQAVWISSTGAMPSGLAQGTTYFVFPSTIQTGAWSLALTSTGAIAMSAVSWSNIGSGTDAFHFLANGGNSIRFQASNDGTNWTDIANSSTTFSGNGSTLWNFSLQYYRWLRAVYNAVSGSYRMVVTGNGESATPGQ